MKRMVLALAAVSALLAACEDYDMTGPRPLQGRRIYAVDTRNNLLLLGSESPGTISRITPISGLQQGEQVLGIDFRPTVAAGVPTSEIGVLYGVTSANRVIKIDTVTATASVVSGLVAGGNAFALAGTSFGVDFNPTVDRVRVHSEARQNLRLNQTVTPVAVTVDTALAYITGDANEGANPSIVASAYTFAAIGGTTSLLAIDASRDIIALSERPNGGTLRTIAQLPINTGNDAGFDIGADGTAFVVLATAGASRSTLYLVNGLPTNAQFLRRGEIRALLRGIAVAP